MLRILVLALPLGLFSAGCEGLGDTLSDLTSPSPTTPSNFAPAAVEGRTISFSFQGCGYTGATFQFSGGLASVTSNFIVSVAPVTYVRNSGTTATLNVTWTGSLDRFDLTFTSESGGTFNVYIGGTGCSASGTFTIS